MKLQIEENVGKNFHLVVKLNWILKFYGLIENYVCFIKFYEKKWAHVVGKTIRHMYIQGKVNAT